MQYASTDRLGYEIMARAQMRYVVHDGNGFLIAMLGFSTAAWKLAEGRGLRQSGRGE